ncbi:MAG: hypothetical protein ACI9JN_001296, partial [Bacteroidia bacterium]
MQGEIDFYKKIIALMVKYDSPAQLTIEEFKTPFQSTLLPDNKWVKLSS